MDNINKLSKNFNEKKIEINSKKPKYNRSRSHFIKQ